MFFVALLFVPIVFGFQSSFNYGCQDGKCIYQLVVPKEVAQFIQEQTLKTEVNTISNSLTALNRTIQNFGGADTTAFTQKFNDNFTTVNTTAQSLNTNVQTATATATSLVTASANANATAYLLYSSIECFKANINSSYECFSPPTTVAPQTTATPSVEVTSTVTGGTTGSSDVPVTGVTGGSTGAPVTGGTAGSSVVPVTGVTGGSTGAPVTEGATGSSAVPVTDSTGSSTAAIASTSTEAPSTAQPPTKSSTATLNKNEQ